MKAIDLRIGNYVMSPLGEIMRIDQIGHLDFPDYIHAMNETEFGQNGFEGIELTPEILEKCGFVKQNNGWNKNKKSEYDENHFGLFDYNFCSGELDLKYNVGNGPIPSIKYLHQLQNLYFALTGQELEVKL